MTHKPTVVTSDEDPTSEPCLGAWQSMLMDVMVWMNTTPSALSGTSPKYPQEHAGYLGEEVQVEEVMS